MRRILKSLQRVAALLPQTSHGRSGAEAYFQRTYHLGNIIGMDSLRRSSINTVQEFVQITGATSCCTLSQPDAEFF